MANPAKDPKLGAPKIDNPQLQAGGGTASAASKARIVDTLSPQLVQHLRTAHEEFVKKYQIETKEGQTRWLTDEQQCSAQDADLLQDGSFSHFANYFLSGLANVMKPAQAVDESYNIYIPR